jgi:hypothetical protein
MQATRSVCVARCSIASKLCSYEVGVVRLEGSGLTDAHKKTGPKAGFLYIRRIA